MYTERVHASFMPLWVSNVVSENLASHAVVFRGLVFFTAFVGRRLYDSPKKRLRGRLVKTWNLPGSDVFFFLIDGYLISLT